MISGGTRGTLRDAQARSRLQHARWEHKQARLGAGLGMLAAVVAIGVVVSGAQALAEWRDGRLPVPGTAALVAYGDRSPTVSAHAGDGRTIAGSAR